MGVIALFGSLGTSVLCALARHLARCARRASARCTSSSSGSSSPTAFCSAMLARSRSTRSISLNTDIPLVWLGRLGTLYYFAHFRVIMPLVGWYREAEARCPTASPSSVLARRRRNSDAAPISDHHPAIALIAATRFAQSALGIDATAAGRKPRRRRRGRTRARTCRHFGACEAASGHGARRSPPAAVRSAPAAAPSCRRPMRLPHEPRETSSRSRGRSARSTARRCSAASRSTRKSAAACHGLEPRRLPHSGR